MNQNLPEVLSADKVLQVAVGEQHSQECNLVANDDTDAAFAVHDSGLSSGSVPLLLDLELTLVSAAARFCGTMIAAVPEEVGDGAFF